MVTQDHAYHSDSSILLFLFTDSFKSLEREQEEDCLSSIAHCLGSVRNSLSNSAAALICPFLLRNTLFFICLTD